MSQGKNENTDRIGKVTCEQCQEKLQAIHFF